MDHTSARAQRIASTVSAYDSPILIIGDSHIERMEVACCQGEEYGDHPVFFAGIAGATFSTFRDYMPWTEMASTTPHKIIIMGGINDAINGVGYSEQGDLQQAAWWPMMQTVASAKSICSSVSIATDPAPEQSAGVNPYRVHQTARMLWYLATLDWVQFGWASSPGPFGFIDIYGVSTSTYSSPVYTLSGCTLDDIHFPRETMLQLRDTLLA